MLGAGAGIRPSVGNTSKGLRQIKEGDWECSDPSCGNVNFSKRTKCHRCGTPKPKTGDPLLDVAHFGGPPGLFKHGDWPCTQCGNVNWARRDKCNICNASKPVNKVEPRTGRGGGHYDLQDPADRNKHDSDNEVYDEFGRKKSKRRPASAVSMRSSSAGDDSRQRFDSTAYPPDNLDYTVKLAFPPAPPAARQNFPKSCPQPVYAAPESSSGSSHTSSASRSPSSERSSQSSGVDDRRGDHHHHQIRRYSSRSRSRSPSRRSSSNSKPPSSYPRSSRDRERSRSSLSPRGYSSHSKHRRRVH